MVEGDRLEATIQSLKEAYKGFKPLSDMVSREGGIPEWRPVRFSLVKVLRWEISGASACANRVGGTGVGRSTVAWRPSGSPGQVNGARQTEEAARPAGHHDHSDPCADGWQATGTNGLAFVDRGAVVRPGEAARPLGDHSGRRRPQRRTARDVCRNPESFEAPPQRVLGHLFWVSSSHLSLALRFLLLTHHRDDAAPPST